MKNSSKKDDFSLEDDDFSTKSSDFSKSDDSIVTENLLEASTEDRCDVTTENSRKESTENRIEIETEDRTEIETENRTEIETENCTEIVISIEKDEFEAFARLRDLVIMIKRTFSLNDILIDIRMSFQITNENTEMKNRNSTQKQHEKITIFMKIHSFSSCLFEIIDIHIYHFDRHICRFDIHIFRILILDNFIVYFREICQNIENFIHSFISS